MRGEKELSVDTHVRPSPVEALAKIRAAFGGVQTGGNSSAGVDGAAAALVSSSAYAKKQGKQPLARIAAGITIGVPPEVMGIGPVPAIKALLERTGLKLTEIDRFQINEAFGAPGVARAGGGPGLGAATAAKLAEGGAKVAILDVNMDGANAVAAKIGGLAIKCDVSDSDAAVAAVKAARAKHGIPRILVNCAGIGTAKRIVGKDGAHPLAEFERVIKINLIGTFNLMRLP